MNKDVLKFYQPPKILDDVVRTYSALIVGQCVLTFAMWYHFAGEGGANFLKFKLYVACAYTFVFAMHSLIFYTDTTKAKTGQNGWNKGIFIFVIMFGAMAVCYLICGLGMYFNDMSGMSGGSAGGGKSTVTVTNTETLKS